MGSGIVPDKATAKIQWYNDRMALWAANATQIGSSAAEIAALQALVTAAQASLTDQGAKKAAAQSATATFHNDVLAMANAGSAVIEKVRVAARVDPSVYQLADIPAPATPTPVGAPGTPSNFKVGLQVNGSLELKWKCANPAGCTGVVYQVWRRSTATGPFTYIGAAGLREFTDSTIPAGATQITYQVQAVRSTSAGPWAQVNVNFGTGASGQMTASVVETTGKVAA